MIRSTLRTTLDQIVSDYGLDILKDGKRVLAMFSDYRPDGRVEKNKLRIAYEFDIVRLLTNAPENIADASIACKKAVDILQGQAFIDNSIAVAIVRDVADALGLQYNLNMDSEGVTQEPIRAHRNGDNFKPDKALQQEHHHNNVRIQDSVRKQPAAPTWCPGSGIGYSTHNNPISPYQAYEDLESQQNMDLTVFDKITHPLRTLLSAFRMHSKYRIACEWEKAQMYCNVYDAYVLDGEGFSPSVVKYKKYNEKHIKKLERKFWS